MAILQMPSVHSSSLCSRNDCAGCDDVRALMADLRHAIKLLHSSSEISILHVVMSKLSSI